MNLPKSIRVGYRDWTIEPMSVGDNLTDRAFGECDKSRAIIKVQPDYGSQKTAETLVHEVLHAAWQMSNLDGKADEESAVTGLARQICQIWRDNPEFISFMSKALSDTNATD